MRYSKKKFRQRYFLAFILAGSILLSCGAGILIGMGITGWAAADILVTAPIESDANGDSLSQTAFGYAPAVQSVYPDEVDGILVYTQLIPEDFISRPGIERTIQYIVIHETDNTDYGADAESHSRYLAENNETYTSWHYTVDDSEIYHHLPDTEVGYHAGDGKYGDGNQHGIGVELCVNSDGNYEATFENAAKLVAYLLDAYDLTIDAVKMHGDFAEKDCPDIMITQGRWDDFIGLVESNLEGYP